nr:arylesterase [Quercus suber]
MGLGMFFHRLAPPRPPKPDFLREIPSQISGKPGTIVLHFYVPKDYNTQRRLWQNSPWDDEEVDDSDHEPAQDKPGVNRRVSLALSTVSQHLRRRSSTGRRWGAYPVVINFHGGGFTLGTAKDDARWCSTVVNECQAVVISVDYRLAPENPFPIAVEDGADAVLWVHEHATELGVDKDKIALSGFSSGANMAFTVPLRLYDEIQGFPREGASIRKQPSRHDLASSDRPPKFATPTYGTPSSSSTQLPPVTTASGNTVEQINPNDPPPSLPRQPTKGAAQVTETDVALPNVSVCCIVPWYPSLDYTRTREQRRATTLRKDQELPQIFTNLFDESYLHPPASITLDSPYLSPGVAPSSLLRAALPHEIILHTCEWDMLLDEGIAFKDRLTSPEIGKHVVYKMIEGVPHGWDKAPNPWKPTPGVREHYLRACKELRRVFGQRKPGAPLALPEHETEQGVSAAPRDSIAVVN